MMKLDALRLPRSIWAIGLMTLLLNLSTVIIFSLSPLYLTQVLGVSTLSVGLLEGVVEFISWTTRVFSGVISDAMRKRKPLLVTSVVMTCVARPLFALGTNVLDVFLSRGLDRVANGLQAPPREALIGDAAPKNKQGASFGLRQSLGVLGSAVGAILTYLWLSQEGGEFQHIFWFASFMPFLALIVILFFVQDKFALKAEVSAQKSGRKRPLHFDQIKTLKKEYWFLLVIAFIFCSSTYSGAFIILRGEEITKAATIGPAVMIAQNILAMLVAYPLGKLFDRWDHRYLLAGGFSMVVMANLFFTFGQSFVFVMVGAALWGVQMGINQSLLTAKISSVTTDSNRGTAFGVYYLTAGSAIFLSNTMIGYFARDFGLKHAFFYSSAMAVLAALCLFRLKQSKKG